MTRQEIVDLVKSASNVGIKNHGYAFALGCAESLLVQLLAKEITIDDAKKVLEDVRSGKTE